MAVSYLFRSTFRQRQPSRLQRRWNVVFFVVALIIALVEGGYPIRAHTFLPHTLPYLALLPILLCDKPRKRQGDVYVTSLDDRAMFKYGAEYETLSQEQQKDILDHYRVGTYVFPRPSQQQTGNTHSKRHYVQQAIRMYSWCAVPVLLVYASGWYWLPRSFVRNAWTNVPVAGTVLLAAVLACQLC